MSNLKALLCSMIFLVPLHSWAQEDADSTVSSVDFPVSEIPIIGMPFSQFEFWFPSRRSSNGPMLGFIGGNYLVYPGENPYIGVFVGLYGTNGHLENFDGDYDYNFDGKLEPLNVSVSSSTYNYRFGMKFTNNMMKSRYRPFSEVSISRILFRSRLSMYEDLGRERTRTIESEVLNRSITTVFHANIGYEIDLMKNATIENRKYKDGVVFFNISIGFIHGIRPINRLDITKYVTDLSQTQNSDMEYRRINSRRTNFSIYVPEREFFIRHFNLTIGFTVRV